MGWSVTPAMMDGNCVAFELTTLLRMMRFIVPTTVCGFRPAKPGAETEEERRADVAHGDAGEGDVFHERAVNRFEREAAAAFKDAVGDGDVLESAVGFGAAA